MDSPKLTYKRYIPSPPLNAYIDDLYYWSGAAPYVCQKVLPVPALNVMVNLGYPFQVYEPDRAEPLIICNESWSVGLWNTYHIVDWPPSVEFFGIHFKAGGAYPFLRFPLSELNGQIVPLDAIWGHYASEIRERLYAVPTIHAGFDLLEQLLLARFSEPPHGLEVVQYAISEIDQHHGALSIQGLSDHIGISQNHLGTQFKRFVGVPTKELTRFYRLAHVLDAIDSAHTIDWTWIAHQSGFYDQSHFNKEFVAFTGHSPTDYLRLRRRVHTENPEHAQVCRNLPID
jgi:AraC-like DNA-binding protein